MAAASLCYVILTEAPYGGIRGPIPAFSSQEAAREWGYMTHRSVNWVAIPALVYEDTPTYALLCALKYGGVQTEVATFADPREALRRGSITCKKCAPRAIQVSLVAPLPSTDASPADPSQIPLKELHIHPFDFGDDV
jgi:hypothetical protein